jgi:hypothetical protein
VVVNPWNTRDPITPEFAAAWERHLANAPHAHYAMRLDFLAWDAGHGRHARAILVDDVPALVVLREVRGVWTSGWPWRTQMAIADPAGRGPEGMTPDEQRRLLAEIARHLGSARSRCYLFQPAEGPLGYPCAATYLSSLDESEDALHARLDGNRKRAIKRAAKEGYEVVEAGTFEQFRAFAELQRAAEARRGEHPEPLPEQVGDHGESWREWELPWMRLLVAVREGQVVAGSGFGFSHHGTIDYRANASSPEARKAGANLLLAWEAVRRGRQAGQHWINWGGSTEFKRHLGGVRVPVWCRLAGGPVWAVQNHMAVSWQRVRPKVAGMWRQVRRRIPNA